MPRSTGVTVVRKALIRILTDPQTPYPEALKAVELLLSITKPRRRRKAEASDQEQIDPAVAAIMARYGSPA